MSSSKNTVAVRVPAELLNVRSTILEAYVWQRISQFARGLQERLQALSPSLTSEMVERAATETLQNLPAPEYGPVPVEQLDLQLVFRHDCLALGCLEPQCVLCQHNPNRRCSVNFDRKYLVNDPLKAKCSATIRVELINRATDLVYEDELIDIRLEMLVLDGNQYDTKFIEQGRTADQDSDKELDACALLQNQKGQHLLVCGNAPDQAGRVYLQLTRGKVPLNDLHITDSSEALLSGRKPPFRLLVRAVNKEGGSVNIRIRHAVSEGFVVATRRTRTANKVEIPSVDDPVGKLEHMGRETVKKLYDIRTAATQGGVEIDVPENCVQKVGEFKQLALRAEQDGHLRQKLQHVLKLSKEKWDEARDHAMRAVVADNRMRAWYADRRSMEIGLLFVCRLGSVDLDRPVGLLQRKVENSETRIEATLMAQTTPAQRETVQTLQRQGAKTWWLSGHPGWAIFPMDSEHFLQTGTLAVVGDVNASPLRSPASPSAESPMHSSGTNVSHPMAQSRMPAHQPPSPSAYGASNPHSPSHAQQHIAARHAAAVAQAHASPTLQMQQQMPGVQPAAVPDMMPQLPVSYQHAAMQALRAAGGGRSPPIGGMQGPRQHMQMPPHSPHAHSHSPPALSPVEQQQLVGGGGYGMGPGTPPPVYTDKHGTGHRSDLDLGPNPFISIQCHKDQLQHEEDISAPSVGLGDLKDPSLDLSGLPTLHIPGGMYNPALHSRRSQRSPHAPRDAYSPWRQGAPAVAPGAAPGGMGGYVGIGGMPMMSEDFEREFQGFLTDGMETSLNGVQGQQSGGITPGLSAFLKSLDMPVDSLAALFPDFAMDPAKLNQLQLQYQLQEYQRQMGAHPGGMPLQQRNSGLESMQSIEQALPNISANANNMNNKHG